MPNERVINTFLDEAEPALARNDWPAALERARLVLDPNNEDGKQYRVAAERGMAEEAQNIAPPQQPGAVVTERPSHPSSFASGRYAVKKFLGEGGEKKVYFAHDTTLDRDIAFAYQDGPGAGPRASRVWRCR